MSRSISQDSKTSEIFTAFRLRRPVSLSTPIKGAHCIMTHVGGENCRRNPCRNASRHSGVKADAVGKPDAVL